MRFEFTEDVCVDDMKGQRRPIAKGTTVNAKLGNEIIIDRTGKEPREVDTGRKYVVSSDADILPGCLTSCMRTGRIEQVAEQQPAAPQTAVKK